MTITFPDEWVPILADLLEQAKDKLSCAGCNDYPLPNTEEHRALWDKMQAWNLNLSVKDVRAHKEYNAPRAEGDLYFMDWFLMAYFRAVLTGKVAA